MCEPATIAMLVVSAVTAVAGHQAQSQQAKAEDKATKIAYANDQTQLAEQYKQQNDELNQQQTERSRAAMFEKGRLNAAYGEAGVEGASLDRILNQSDFNLGTDLSTMEANRSNLTKQTMLEGRGLQSTAQSRFNSTMRPSRLNTGLQIAGSAVDAYSSYKSSQAKRK